MLPTFPAQFDSASSTLQPTLQPVAQASADGAHGAKNSSSAADFASMFLTHAKSDNTQSAIALVPSSLRQFPDAEAHLRRDNPQIGSQQSPTNQPNALSGEMLPVGGSQLPQPDVEPYAQYPEPNTVQNPADQLPINGAAFFSDTVVLEPEARRSQVGAQPQSHASKARLEPGIALLVDENPVKANSSATDGGIVSGYVDGVARPHLLASEQSRMDMTHITRQPSEAIRYNSYSSTPSGHGQVKQPGTASGHDVTNARVRNAVERLIQLGTRASGGLRTASEVTGHLPSDATRTQPSPSVHESLVRTPMAEADSVRFVRTPAGGVAEGIGKPRGLFEGTTAGIRIDNVGKGHDGPDQPAGLKNRFPQPNLRSIETASSTINKAELTENKSESKPAAWYASVLGAASQRQLTDRESNLQRRPFGLSAGWQMTLSRNTEVATDSTAIKDLPVEAQVRSVSRSVDLTDVSTHTNSTRYEIDKPENMSITRPTTTEGRTDLGESGRELLQRQITDQLMARLSGRVLQSQVIRVELNPRSLGSLLLEVDVRNADVNQQQQEVRISIVAKEAPTRELMEQSLPRLRGLLNDAGIELKDLQLRDPGSHHDGSTEQQYKQPSQVQVAAARQHADDEAAEGIHHLHRTDSTEYLIEAFV